MTPNNLGICIGCSLLYPKDQLSNTSMSSSYASASTILELMIIHHKQFFPNLTQPSEQSFKSFKSQPDIIPTEFIPVIFIILLFFFRINLSFILKKSRSNSNENLLESSNLPGHPQPYVSILFISINDQSNRSPGTRRKAKAPPPPPPPLPPSSSSSQQMQDEQINYPVISSEQTGSESTSNPYLTGNDVGDNKEKKRTKILTAKSFEELSPPPSHLKNIYKRFSKGSFRSLFFLTVNCSSKYCLSLCFCPSSLTIYLFGQ